jgi:hypothetical protein
MKRMGHRLSIASSLLLAACGVATMESGIVRSHRLIEAGRYGLSSVGEYVETLEFQAEGKGRKVTRFSTMDSALWLFDWKTVDWSDGRLRLVTRYYSYQEKNNREILNTTEYQDLKDVTDSSFFLCSADMESCASPDDRVWREYRRED